MKTNILIALVAAVALFAVDAQPVKADAGDSAVSQLYDGLIYNQYAYLYSYAVGDVFNAYYAWVYSYLAYQSALEGDYFLGYYFGFYGYYYANRHYILTGSLFAIYGLIAEYYGCISSYYAFLGF